MLSKTITTIILEGTDGVGKDTIANVMRLNHDNKYGIYVRGELSDYVYAQKYKRPFHSTQRGLPFVYVLLIDLHESIAAKIKKRDGENSKDLDKIEDQTLFIDAAQKLQLDYHIIIYSMHNKSIQQCVKEIYNLVDKYVMSLANDETINDYNKMYENGCKQMNINFSVKNNQPFFNNTMIMADAQLHNGSYETFTDKRCPHNLIFSLGYSLNQNVCKDKTFDFCYIIGSKIKVRPEVQDYLDAFNSAKLTCITKMNTPNKVFGDEYIELISKARATVYTARDLSYLKMITVRGYEAALAEQILFVDELSDADNELLKQIHRDSKYTYLLRVNPNNIVKVYKNLTETDYKNIVQNQHKWYSTLRVECLKNSEYISKNL